MKSKTCPIDFLSSTFFGKPRQRKKGMDNMVIRAFVEKKPGFDVEARHIKADLRENLGLTAIEDLRLWNRYDVDGLSQEEFEAARNTIFSEPNVDNVYGEDFEFPADYQVFAM